MDSVKNQTYQNIQHLVFADGPGTWDGVTLAQMNNGCGTPDYRNDVIALPYSVGKDRWNGHRQYGAGTYLADGDFIIFLDDDNYLEPEHVEQCLEVMKDGAQWTYSFRNIVDKESTVICQDNCESLGKWASILHPEDFFVDVNCFFLPRQLAVQISPIWFCKFREPGQPEIDRKITYALRQIAPKFDSTYHYSVNYNVGNTPISVQDSFFIRGNAEMLKRYNNNLPWVKK
jgi:glycosyltransferase involved in cell wall biosynthesis